MFDHLFLSEATFFSRQDYVNYIRFLRKKGPSMPAQLMGQTLLGAMGGVLGSIPGGLAAMALTKRDPDPNVIIGGISLGYTLGVSLGVYLAAETTNSELSFSYTFGVSSLCMFAGVGLALTELRNNNSVGYELVLLPLIPLISSIAYVNAIAPNPVRDGLYSSKPDLSGLRNLAYKDIYNSNMQIRMNLSSIAL